MSDFDPMPTVRHIEALRWNAGVLRRSIERNPEHPEIRDLLEQEANVNAEIKRLYDDLRTQSRFGHNRKPNR